MRISMGIYGSDWVARMLPAFIEHLETLVGYSPEMLVIGEQNTRVGRDIVLKHGGTWRGFHQDGKFCIARAQNVSIYGAEKGVILNHGTVDYRFPPDFLLRARDVWLEQGSPEMFFAGCAVRYNSMGMCPPVQYAYNLRHGGRTYRHFLIRVWTPKLWNEINGFDESFAGYGSEDRDFEVRARRAPGVVVHETNRLVYQHIPHAHRTQPEWFTEEARGANSQRLIACVEDKTRIKANVDKPWGQFDDEEIHL